MGTASNWLINKACQKIWVILTKDRLFRDSPLFLISSAFLSFPLIKYKLVTGLGLVFRFVISARGHVTQFTPF